MGNIFTKLFKRSEWVSRVPVDGFKTSLDETPAEKNKEVRNHNFYPSRKDIIVKPDVAFYKPASKVIDEIKSKFGETDYTNLEFEEDIEDFNLKTLSPEAKKLIIQIIKEDNKHRESKITTYTDSKTVSEILPQPNLPKKPTQYGINVKTRAVEPIDEFSSNDVISFTEYNKLEKQRMGEELLENKEELLYRLVSTYFPGNTHEENIEFIKQNLKLDEDKD